MKKVQQSVDKLHKLQHGQVNSAWYILVGIILVLIILIVLPTIITTYGPTAKSFLESSGYVVMAASDYNILNAKLDAIKVSADAAVANAEAAVIAAQTAATKVDLFNSAEVFLLPATTNTTLTLTAGNTNTFSNWAEITANNGTTLSSKFATKEGYISDMYIYDHSAVDKLYLVEIAYGEGKTTLGRVSYHTSFIEMAPIKSRLIPAGETVYYRMMCSGANGATAKVGFRYFYK